MCIRDRSWIAPSDDGGSALTGYVVTPYIAGVAQAPIDFTSTATTEVVSGLSDGTAYTFTVAASNVMGQGPASVASGAVIPATVPGAPTTVTAAALGGAGSGQVEVSWTAPSSDGGSAIVSYSVTPYFNGVAQTPIVVAGTSAAVSGLIIGEPVSYTHL